MQDVILLVSTSAIFVFGYFLMKKLDVFLENNWNEQDLETYGKQHPDVSIYIFSREESELCRELETHKLDIH